MKSFFNWNLARKHGNISAAEKSYRLVPLQMATPEERTSFKMQSYADQHSLGAPIQMNWFRCSTQHIEE